MDSIKTQEHDKEIALLAARVHELDDDVKKLREEFESHLVIEDTRYREIILALADIKIKIDQLCVEIKDPIEAYKTGKYGVGFVKGFVDMAKWAGPLLLGVLIGFGPVRNGYISVGAPQQQIQQEQNTKDNTHDRDYTKEMVKK